MCQFAFTHYMFNFKPITFSAQQLLCDILFKHFSRKGQRRNSHLIPKDLNTM